MWCAVIFGGRCGVCSYYCQRVHPAPVPNIEFQTDSLFGQQDVRFLLGVGIAWRETNPMPAPSIPDDPREAARAAVLSSVKPR